MLRDGDQPLRGYQVEGTGVELRREGRVECIVDGGPFGTADNLRGVAVEIFDDSIGLKVLVSLGPVISVMLRRIKLTLASLIAVGVTAGSAWLKIVRSPNIEIAHSILMPIHLSIASLETPDGRNAVQGKYLG